MDKKPTEQQKDRMRETGRQNWNKYVAKQEKEQAKQPKTAKKR